MRCSLLSAVLVVAAGATPALSSLDIGLNAALSFRKLADDLHGDLDRHLAATFGIDLGRESWPVQLAFGISGSSASTRLGGERVAYDLYEVSTGFVWLPWKGRLKTGGRRQQLYLGGGVSFLLASVDDTSCGYPEPCDLEKYAKNDPFEGDDDTTAALYVDGGYLWPVTQSLFLGLDVRWTTGADVELLDTEMDSSFLQVGLALSVRF